MTCQETLLKQAQTVKAVTPGTKVFIYRYSFTIQLQGIHLTFHFLVRNLVKALPWYSQVRDKMLDPAYSGWFLRFKDGAKGTGYHVPPCTGNKCSDFCEQLVRILTCPAAPDLKICRP